MIGFLISITSITAVAKEGGVTVEGGGHGVACVRKIAFGQTVTVELLDMYEYRRINNIRLRAHDEDSVDASWTVPARICRLLMEKKVEAIRKYGSSASVLQAFDKACKLVDLVRREEFIRDTFDWGSLRVPLEKECQLIQIANRSVGSSGEIVRIDHTAAQYLTHVDLAALLLHEALHETMGGASTVQIRDFVASTFMQ